MSMESQFLKNTHFFLSIYSNHPEKKLVRDNFVELEWKEENTFSLLVAWVQIFPTQKNKHFKHPRRIFVKCTRVKQGKKKGKNGSLNQHSSRVMDIVILCVSMHTIDRRQFQSEVFSVAYRATRLLAWLSHKSLKYNVVCEIIFAKKHIRWAEWMGMNDSHLFNSP